MFERSKSKQIKTIFTEYNRIVFLQIADLKVTLQDKDRHYQREMCKVQSKTDLDILELRRIMDKIDMSHHDRFENLVKEHEKEIGENGETKLESILN